MNALRTLILPALLALTTLPAWAAGAVVTTPQVKAELVAHAPEGVAAGKPLWLGLKIEHKPHWHTYWKNPGDSGLPTRLEWQLPAGVSAGEIEWPTPSKLPLGPLMNYGYEGTLLLPVAIAVPADFKGEALDVKLYAEWLVCKDVCIPESGDFTLRLPAMAATAAHAALFDATRARMPQPAAGSSASATLDGHTLVVQVTGLPAAWQGKELHFFPETPGLIANAAKPQATWQGADWSARVPLDTQRAGGPPPGVALGNGLCPWYTEHDPYRMAWAACRAATMTSTATCLRNVPRCRLGQIGWTRLPSKSSNCPSCRCDRAQSAGASCSDSRRAASEWT